MRLFSSALDLETCKLFSIYNVQLKHFKFDFTFLSYHDYLEIFDGDSKTAPSLTKWGGLGIPSGFDYRNNIFKCDGDIKCDGDYKCQLDPNCNTGSMKASAVQLISGESSMLVTPEQWVEKVHKHIWITTVVKITQKIKMK